MLKKTLCILLTLVLTVAMVACQRGEDSTLSTSSTAAASSGNTVNSSSPSDKAEVAMAPLTISGYSGDPTKYQKAMVEMFNTQYPDIKVDMVITDTNSREQVLKTAISAGDPPNVGFYWGTRVNSFYNSDMCLDLREYFTTEELALLDKSMLEPCLGPNGEVYALPFSTVYHTVFYNKEMMAKYGFEIPQTWDDMTKIFERLKQDNIFGFSTNSASMQDCLYGITYAELESKVGPGTAYDVASGDVSVAPGSPAGKVIHSCIEQVQRWYDAGYWYPGEGGINTTQDDGNVGFSQGRCLMNFNFSGAFATLDGLSEFEIGTFMKPTSAAGMLSFENIEPDVYFIPSNCTPEQIASAVAFLKIGLTKENQQSIVDSNNIPAIMSYEYENISPILLEIMSKFETGGLMAGLNPTRTSSEMQTFIKQKIFAGPLGKTMTIDQALEEMERIRLAA